jgi:hypothetical protein
MHHFALVRERGPDLLAGDAEAAVLLHRLGLERGEVGAGFGLGEPLAPDLLSREDRLEEPLLLVLGAMRDHHRPAHHQAQDVRGPRRLRPRQLLTEDRLLDQRRTPAAVLLRPGDPRPAGHVELALPLALELELRLVAAARRRPGVVVRDPGANLVPERRFFGRQRQVHGDGETIGGGGNSAGAA